MTLACRFIEIDAVHEVGADGFGDVLALVGRNGLQAAADRRREVAALKRASDRTRHAAGPPSARFTERRTASAKRELKPARPPHPDTASSSAPGSRLEMSVAVTWFASPYASAYVAY